MRAASIALLSLVLVLAGCSAMAPEDFRNTEPRLVLEEFFAGETRAYGIFEDRFGTLRRQFEVEIDGTWDGTELVLDERFVYDDGARERRVWRIEKTGDHAYEGRADDVIGTARGKSYGNALSWRYDVDLKIGDDTLRVTFDDWMFLQAHDVLLNRARVSKFGIELGTVTIVFLKGAAMPPSPSAGEPSAVASRP